MGMKNNVFQALDKASIREYKYYNNHTERKRFSLKYGVEEYEEEKANEIVLGFNWENSEKGMTLLSEELYLSGGLVKYLKNSLGKTNNNFDFHSLENNSNSFATSEDDFNKKVNYIKKVVDNANIVIDREKKTFQCISDCASEIKEQAIYRIIYYDLDNNDFKNVVINNEIEWNEFCLKIKK